MLITSIGYICLGVGVVGLIMVIVYVVMAELCNVIEKPKLSRFCDILYGLMLGVGKVSLILFMTTTLLVMVTQ